MAGRIPQETLDVIMSRCDIVEVIGEYVQLQRKGRNYFGLCPFHGEDTASFSVSADKQFFKCFGCGEGGNVIGFIMKIEGLSFPEAARKLADRCGVIIPEKDLTPQQIAAQQEKQRLLAVHEEAASFYASILPQSPAALAYLKKRGIDRTMAERFGLGFAPEADWQALTKHLTEKGYSEDMLIKAGLVSRSAKNGRCFDKFHGRLIFPICDNKGAVIAFGGRAIGDEQPKYLNSMSTPIYNKSNQLFALNLASQAIAKEKRVFIMEGYMDVLTAHQFGITNAVASLGTAFTDQQARLLQRLAPPLPEKLEVMLSFDGDGAGAKAAMASLEKLNRCDFAEAKVVVYPQKLDPDEFLRKYEARGWQRLMERYCYPMLDYLLLRALERHDRETASGKGAIVADLLPAIAACASLTERESFIRRVARELQVSETAINADLAKSGLLDGKKLPAAPRKPVTPRQASTKAGKADMQLMALAVNNKEIFDLAKKELGGDFGSTTEERQLISLIDQLGDAYDFKPSSLFNHLSEDFEGLRQFMLKLLESDIEQYDPNVLANSCIHTVRQERLKSRIAEINEKLNAQESNGVDCHELLAEKQRLTQLLHGSR